MFVHSHVRLDFFSEWSRLWSYYIEAKATSLCRWTAIRWPQKIISQMEAAAAQHLEDEERFTKIQLADQNNFEDHLDSLKVSRAE